MVRQKKPASDLKMKIYNNPCQWKNYALEKKKRKVQPCHTN